MYAKAAKDRFFSPIELTRNTDITALTSYLSMLEVGLGLRASWLPVLYGLLYSQDSSRYSLHHCFAWILC
ncbi:hypothetical protein EV356DRAFT_87543 [Viridothelium virens]|uniref:Uncharacterized protein n=1 Tax=Viridothelium virens TaxID=1048519 RepID=A0A6A6GS01_VIRVR|nr:hypothetical protein EV356DRAFT_87543 [Viridothelium virens]